MQRHPTTGLGCTLTMTATYERSACTHDQTQNQAAPSQRNVHTSCTHDQIQHQAKHADWHHVHATSQGGKEVRSHADPSEAEPFLF